MAVQINQTATQVNNTVKSIFGVLETTVKNIIIADNPWLKAPIINQLFSLLLSYFFNAASRAAQEAGTFAVIDTQVNSEVKGMSSALAAIATAEQSGDTNAIQAAIQQYALAQKALVTNDGSAVSK